MNNEDGAAKKSPPGDDEGQMEEDDDDEYDEEGAELEEVGYESLDEEDSKDEDDEILMGLLKLLTTLTKRFPRELLQGFGQDSSKTAGGKVEETRR